MPTTAILLPDQANIIGVFFKKVARLVPSIGSLLECLVNYWQCTISWLREGKNCTTSKAGMLVFSSLAYPVRTICVGSRPASSVECWHTLPSWLRWKLSSLAALNCILLASSFSMSFPSVLRSAIGLKALGVEYEGFPSFGIITDRDSLNVIGQWHTLRQMLAIKRRTCMQYASFTSTLRCGHAMWSWTWSRPVWACQQTVEKLLQGERNPLACFFRIGQGIDNWCITNMARGCVVSAMNCVPGAAHFVTRLSTVLDSLASRYLVLLNPLYEVP
jgi:hypothetical protein